MFPYGKPSCVSSACAEELCNPEYASTLATSPTRIHLSVHRVFVEEEDGRRFRKRSSLTNAVQRASKEAERNPQNRQFTIFSNLVTANPRCLGLEGTINFLLQNFIHILIYEAQMSEESQGRFNVYC